MSDSLPKEITRRGFITKVGQGLVAANLAGTLLKSAAAAPSPRSAGKEIRMGHCRPGQPCDQPDPARIREM